MLIDTHAHLKMSVDFNLYIWNGIILEAGQENERYSKIVQKSQKLLNSLRAKSGLPKLDLLISVKNTSVSF